jgi:hypothetical protein
MLKLNSMPFSFSIFGGSSIILIIVVLVGIEVIKLIGRQLHQLKK